jgi:methyl-accepting chemotaxis protein
LRGERKTLAHRESLAQENITVRNIMLAVALVAAFQAGRLVPIQGSRYVVAGPPTAFAQAAEDCPDPTAPDADACKPAAQLSPEMAALADRIALETLQRLAIQSPALTEAVKLKLMSIAESIQLRLGDESEQLKGLVGTTQAMMVRTSGLLDSTDKVLDKSEHVLNETDDTLNETDDTLDETNETLHDADKAIDRSNKLLDDTETLVKRSQTVARKLDEDVAAFRAIIDNLR